MSSLPVLLIVLGNTLALVLGVVLTHLVLRANRRRKSEDIRLLGYGFGFITLSLIFGGGMHVLMGVITYGVAVREVLTALGFGFILYSLLMRGGERTSTVKAE